MVWEARGDTVTNRLLSSPHYGNGQCSCKERDREMIKKSAMTNYHEIIDNSDRKYNVYKTVCQ